MYDLSPSDIAEFKTLFKKETGKDITDEEARKYANNLLGLVDVVLSPSSHEVHRETD